MNTITSQADFEALKKRLPRPSAFPLTFEGPEGVLTVSALLSTEGEVWAIFPHDTEVIFRVPSYEGLIGDDLDYEDFTLPLVAKLFGHG
jgi:hypothetical protein